MSEALSDAAGLPARQAALQLLTAALSRRGGLDEGLAHPAMARLAPEGPYAGLAPEDRLAKGPMPDLDLFDASEPDAETLEAMALEAENAARAVPGVTYRDGDAIRQTASIARFVSEAVTASRRPPRGCAPPAL